MDYYDPVKLAEETKKIVIRGNLRKYYRVGRPSRRWYGGIADAHCCGCCLRCIFCWSGFPRDHPEAIGKFYSPEQIFDGLTKCTRKYGFKKLRVTGNEPTIGKEHILRLLELVNQTNLLYVLETNGILIGSDPDYAEQLSQFRNVHVRVSLKGTERNEFSRLTGASPEGFDFQLKALTNLFSAGVSCHPAVMLSFSNKEGVEKLKLMLREIHPSLEKSVEQEYVILYPPVVQRLKAAGVEPHTAFKPHIIYRNKYYHSS